MSKNGAPVATRTSAGWILNGKTTQPGDSELACFVICREEESVDQQLKEFWQIEEINGEKSSLSEEERRCETVYDETTIREQSGKYQVRLPFRNGKPILGRSRNIAVAQLFGVEKKFRADPQFKQQYIDNMREYFENGHIVEVNTTEDQHKTTINGEETFTCAYLPHHAVLKTTSSTTKCRCVCNASRRTTNGKTLNEQLLTGPTIQDDIMAILMRWRTYEFVINADIARMYRQIIMNDEDSEYQRVVWRENENEPIRDFKLITVTFGTTPAPYLAIKTIHRLADDEAENFPLAAPAAKRDFYVDDFFSGSETRERAIKLRVEITEMMSKGGFQIRKWIANDELTLADVPEEERGIPNSLEFDINSTVKTLGVQWNPKTDCFSYKTASIAANDEVPTKRKFLSTTAKIYDPIGWLAPTTILIKILYQKLWIHGTKWDETIPQEINGVYQKYRIEFPLLERIRVPQWIKTVSTCSIQLHGFCDASNDAYSATIYTRIIEDDEKVNVSLFAAKTRVAPIQKLTTPKLELSAAVLLVRLFEKVKKVIKRDHIECYAWSDSTITLAWIRNNGTKLQTFVANRVGEIRAAGLIWRHVPTHDNPADCASRGLTPSALIDHQLWWQGPSFLQQSPEYWPEDATCPINETQIQIFSILTEPIQLWPLEKYSSFEKLQRVVAYCHRFINNCKQRRKTFGPLTAAELNLASDSIVRNVQRESYHEEIQLLQNNESVRGHLNPLNPFLDNNFIMRVNGRLANGNLPYNQKHPMILPKSHHVTHLIILYAHRMTLHGGATSTLTFLRNKFWIPKGLNTVKKYIRSCQQCARFNAKTMTQRMAALPEVRLNVSRPFTHTGIDFAGPIDIRTSSGRGQKTSKGYICIFICLTTKSIHIEAVSSLTSTAFIASLRRFCSRRGQIKHLYSDNGTNFVGANKLLAALEKHEKRQFEEDISNALAANGIQWHFNPPAAPHFGELWEAGVKSIKTHLKRMGKTNFTYEEFTTLLTQIEACLNSRPLCPLNDDPTNLDVLTPGHFLVGSSLLAPPDDTIDELQSSTISRWQAVQRQIHLFWKKWGTEYRQRLQQRPKWLNQRQNLEINDLVLIKDDNSPPTQLLKGRVSRVYPGSDGLVRVATLRTVKGEIKRPITKLCLLPKLTPVEATAVNDLENSKINKKRSTLKPIKRTYNLRPRALINQFTLIALFGLFAKIFGSPFNVTTFSNQPGIYFEQIGDVRFITGDWTILIHYNLSNYLQYHTQQLQTIEQMRKLCDEINYEQPSCRAVIEQFEIKLHELNLGDEFIKINQLHNRRQRRSPFDFIGMIASEAFGVLDQRYAKEYVAEIQKTRENEQNTAKLLDQHVSIMQATSQIIYHNEEKVRSGFDIMQKNLERIKKSYTDDHLLLSEQKRHQIFLDMGLQLMILSSRMEVIQRNLIDIIIDTHHGKLNPLLFPVEEVRKQITLIKNHLSAELSIPSDVAELYSTMRVRTCSIESTVLFEVKIPLQSSREFQLYRIQPMPIIEQNETLYVQPSTEYLIINLQRTLFYPLNEIELLRCTRRRENSYACHQKHPLYKTTSGKCSCEIGILTHTGISSSCQVHRGEGVSFWSQLTTTNRWLYVANDSKTIDILCGDKLHTQTLRGSGIINFYDQCIIEQLNFVIRSLKTIRSTINASFIPPFNLTDILRDQPKQLVLRDVRYNTDTSLQQLNEQINDLKNKHFKPYVAHNVHHYVSIYVLLLICIIIFIIIHKKRHIPRLKFKKKVQIPECSTNIEEAPECLEIQT
ncbi:uncharacterized protein LOC129574779 [Sitodiplosis mosellana]|uniref:uncharacterized protein LOC129574779 n=1 Tax=Sitodiplosis mosellana TaxID=263140 RepID=UPI0024444E21|nr:uncharacterized protein LOC129574779 [Sitodiplosis mosellana]